MDINSSPDASASPSEEAVPVSPPAAPRFTAVRARNRVVLLDWPIEYDGRTYDRVTVRRPTAQDVADFAARVNAAPEGESVHFPMYDVPFAVPDALDPDDTDAVNVAVADFLPRRWGGASAPAPVSGSTTEP